MKRIFLVMLFIPFATILSLRANVSQQTAGQAFERALQVEEVQGDLQKAISLYQKVLQDFPKNREVGAKALLHIAQCQQKLGNAEARKSYEQLLRDYPDQIEPAAEARARLAELAGGSKPTIRRIWIGDTADEASISPDGRYIAIADQDYGRLVSLQLPGGRVIPIIPQDVWDYVNPITSPDGKLIAYVWSGQEGAKELRLIAPDGSAGRVLLRGTASYTPIGWLPNGKQILTGISDSKAGTRQLVLVAAGDGSTRVIRERAPAFDRARLSPDGRFLAYEVRTSEDPVRKDIFALAIENGQEYPLVQHPSDDSLFDWTRDVRQLLFASDRSGARDLWLMPVSNGRPAGVPKRVRQDVGDIAPIGFVRDSFYYVDYVRDIEAYTATVDFETGRTLVPPALVTQRFAGTNASPVWSPDGQSLLYISMRGSERIAAIRNMTTGKEWDLAPDLTLISHASWSPDGQSIIALARDSLKKWCVFRVDAETSKTTVLVPEGRYSPRLCPDMKTLLYTYTPRQGQMAIGMRNLETGEEKQVVPVAHSLCWALSRDGRLLAFLDSDTATKEPVLKVMPLAGGEAREIMRLKDRWRLTWFPDNRNLLIVRGAFPNMTLYRVPIDGGKPLQLDLKIRGIHSASMHPDGRQIAFWVWNSKAEIWVMEGFREQ